MQHELFEKPVKSLYMAYLIPTLIGMLSNSMYCLVDVYFISKGSGSIGLAALNIAMPMFTMYSAIGLSFGVGGATVMAIAYGAKDEDTRNRAFTMCIWMMLIIGLIFTVVGSIFLPQFARLLGASEELLPHVIAYMRPIHLAGFAFVLMYSSSILLRADHNPKLAMNALLIGNVANMILDYVFVMVFEMGISGAAIATAISPCITVALSSLHFLRKQHTVTFVKHWFSMDLLRRIWSNGLGSGVMEISAGVVILLFNAVILWIGDATVLAAYAIITNIAYVAKGLFNGFAQAAQPIISSNYGANRLDRVKEALHCSLIYAAIFSLLCYVVFLLFPGNVAALFANGDQSLITTSILGIRLYFLCLVFLACNTMFMYYFQSLEYGRIATILAVCKGLIFVVIGLVVLVPWLHINGVWLSVTLAESLCFVIALWAYKRTQRNHVALS